MNRTTAIFGIFLIFVAMHELEGFTAGIGNAGLGKRDYVSKVIQIVLKYNLLSCRQAFKKFRKNYYCSGKNFYLLSQFHY